MCVEGRARGGCLKLCFFVVVLYCLSVCVCVCVWGGGGERLLCCVCVGGDLLVLVLLFFVCVGTCEVFLIPHTTSNQFLSIFQSPHCIHMRSGVKFGDASLTDTMLKDGLWDAFNDYHMGITAENVAKQFDITREQQDEFAALSQNKAESAQKSDIFKPEITPVTIQSRKGMLVFPILISQWNLSTRDKLGMGPLSPVHRGTQ